jgi:hypothetical protein
LAHFLQQHFLAPTEFPTSKIKQKTVTAKKRKGKAISSLPFPFSAAH